MDTPSNTNLANCHTCNGIVSRQAKICPHCGQKSPYRKPGTIPTPIVWLLAIGGFIFVPSLLTNLAGIKTSEVPQQIGPANTPYPEESSKELCNKKIKETIINPSTLNISSTWGYETLVLQDGTRRILQKFSAKNSFNLEQHYEALCLITPDGKAEMVMREQERE